MTTREQRLAVLGGIVLVLAGAYVTDLWLAGKRKALATEVESLRTEIEQAEALLPYEAELDETQSWLAEAATEPVSTTDAQSALQADVARAAADAGLMITDRQLLDSDGVAGWGQARFRVSVVGDEERVVRLIAGLRDPERLQAPEALQLEPNDELTALAADITVRRLYRPAASLATNES